MKAKILALLGILGLVLCAGGAVYAAVMNTYTNETNLADDDEFLVWDTSEGTGTVNNITWAGLKAEIAAESYALGLVAANEATDETCFPLFVTAATGSLEGKTNAGLAFNSATGLLTATGFSGPLTGNVTGNCSGTAASLSGNALPAASTVATSIAIGADPSEAGVLMLSNGAAIGWEDGTEATITHVNDIGLQTNLLFTSTGGLSAGNLAAGAGFLRFLEDTDNGADYSTITGAADAGTYPSFTFGGSQGSEDLTLAVTAANTWTVSSSTGVTDVKFQGAAAANALNLVTTGYILGALRIIDMSTGATYALAAADAYGVLLLMTDTDSVTTVSLPDYQAAADADHVKLGASVCVLNLQAQATIVDPSADDKIRTSNGTLNGAGVSITGPATVGAYSCYVLTDTATDVGHWTQMGMNGAWPVTP